MTEQSAASSIIRCADLWRTYQMGEETIHALRGVSFEIQPNEYLAIMGPSGSGKSTLMNLIGCLDTPSQGEYYLRNQLVSKMSDDSLAEVRNKEIGFVFQKQRRKFFKAMGAKATDHAALTPNTEELTLSEAESIFQAAIHGKADASDATRFTAHMLMEMARMSIDDGLVMQLHSGSLRNHNEIIFQKFGLDKGADIPVQTEYTRKPCFHC